MNEIHPDLEAKIRERLHALPGLDLVQGLEYTLNRFPFYVKVLHLFVDSNSEVPNQLRALASQDDQHELGEIIHGLKASTATIGAHALSEQAAAVVDAARNAHPKVLEMALRFADRLEEFLSALGRALEVPAA